ncbi:unnamed protein product [Prorocentrum cordatum]|uniref:Uncharacterized protein n=1 Tax=Prorocentrum cordatum TaxID=2364126 RepID=A0ABN9VCL4_9DINO|nr:unnamed protein product [Polarella glacialis]
MVAAGARHTVLLRSDGTAVACGRSDEGQCVLPGLAAGRAYTQAAAGQDHTVLLRSDGRAVACGLHGEGQCDLPPLGAELAYAGVAAGARHTVLLRSDGTAVVCGRNREGQRDLPALPAGQTYVRVAAGAFHTVLLRSDGVAVACGRNEEGQCDLPDLARGLEYTRVAAGAFHTVLLRSDGNVAACGRNGEGQCDIPALAVGLTYAAHSLPTLVLQALFHCDSLHLMTLFGDEFCRISAAPNDCLSNLYNQVMSHHLIGELGVRFSKVEVVLPGGELLSNVSADETASTIIAAAGGHSADPDKRLASRSCKTEAEHDERRSRPPPLRKKQAAHTNTSGVCGKHVDRHPKHGLRCVVVFSRSLSLSLSLFFSPSLSPTRPTSGLFLVKSPLASRVTVLW